MVLFGGGPSSPGPDGPLGPACGGAVPGGGPGAGPWPGAYPGLLGVEVHSCNLQPGARTGDDQQEARTEGDLDLGDLDNAGLQVVLHRGRVQEGDHGGRQEEGPLH